MFMWSNVIERPIRKDVIGGIRKRPMEVTYSNLTYWDTSSRPPCRLDESDIKECTCQLSGMSKHSEHWGPSRSSILWWSVTSS